MSLKEMLRQNELDNGAPVRVGLVGAGQMGTGLISQIEKMVGMRIVAVADVLPDRAQAAYKEASVDPALIQAVADDPVKAGHLIGQGKRIATQNADMLVQIPNLDVVVECTGIPEVGARICHAAILAQKSIVNMNVETDCTIGYYLGKMAESAGVVYTLTTGDEPGTTRELYDFADTLGFEIVTIGKGKNNPLDITSNPENCAALAKKQNMSPKMLASFRDGTKTMVEMTSMGNGTGYAPEVRGGRGPLIDSYKKLADFFIPRSDGGIMDGKGAVDYAVGDIAPGVFIIITTDQPKIIADLNYLHLAGNGKYWALYRPYHLANLETPIAISRAYLYGESTLTTRQKPVCESLAIAKKDLKPGDKIDGLGGFTVYGSIEKAEVAKKEGLVPLGISVGGMIRKEVKQGQPIHYDEIELDENQTIYFLRKLQDKIVSEQV